MIKKLLYFILPFFFISTSFQRSGGYKTTSASDYLNSLNINGFFILNEKDLFLKFQENGLKVITVNQENELTQAAVINKKEILEMSRGLIEDEESLYFMIEEAINNPSEKLSLSLEENMLNLTLSVNFPTKKSINIKIELKEEQQDPLERMVRMIQRQARKIQELRNKVEKKYSLIGGTSYWKESPTQIKFTYSSPFYTVNANKKVCTRTGGLNGVYYAIISQEFYYTGNDIRYLEIKVKSQNPDYPIWVGIGNFGISDEPFEKMILSKSWDMEKDQIPFILLNCQSGVLNIFGKIKNTGLLCGSESIIRIYYCYKKKFISFEVARNTYNIIKQYSHILNAFIFSAYQNDSVEFL